MKNSVLRTKTTDIPILYNPYSQIVIPPRSEKRVKVPTMLRNGEAILNFLQFFPGVRMPDAVVNCIDSFATTVIQNTTDSEMKITFTKPFKVTKLDSSPETINCNSLNPVYNLDQILEENLSKLRLDHLNLEEKTLIIDLCTEYKDIFYCENVPLSFTNQVKHKIRTSNEDHIYIRPYRQPMSQNLEIQKQVDKLLENKVITESHSPWSAPVHLVPKKLDASGEQKYRMVIDYRRLNEITIDDKYPLPNITDLFDRLGKACYFTTIDLASGYHQIEVNKDDQPKTAFTTQAGHFEFKRMPFGLKTAPATFQRAMDNVLRGLRGLQGIHCLVYLDDIIIYSTSLQEHIVKLRKIFDRLRQTNLKVTLDKCEFLKKEVLYLGHTITKDGLKPNDDKIKAVLQFPLPKTPTEIKSFLGLVGYYRKFIKDFSKITQPLKNCLKKKNKVTITKEFVDAFEKCKELLTNAPLLQYPDFEKPFLLTTDASNFALGAVLSQGPAGSDKPIAFASRTLNDAETRYSAIEKELLAIVWACKHFRPYLYGKKFTILSDHRPLVWLNSIKEPGSRLTRWRLRLAEYDYEIKYKPGKQNCNADALSRIKLNALDDTSMAVNIGKQASSKSINVSAEEDNLDRTPRPRSPYSIRSTDSETLTASEGADRSIIETIHSGENTDTSGIPILNEAIDTKPNQILIYKWFKQDLSVKDLSRPKQKVFEVHLP